MTSKEQIQNLNYRLSKYTMERGDSNRVKVPNI